jgi:hypothetical protein
MDLFVVPTVSFQLLYGLLIMGHSRRRIGHASAAGVLGRAILQKLQPCRQFFAALRGLGGRTRRSVALDQT